MAAAAGGILAAFGAEPEGVVFIAASLSQELGVGYAVRADALQPEAVDVKRDLGVTLRWADGSSSFYPVAYLRRNSPSADQKQLREQLGRNPLTVLPSGGGATGSPLTIVDVQMVGTYAIKITFSDGHDTGIYSWAYLREIAPAHSESSGEKTPSSEPSRDV